jgi:Flp pilus assembly protein TadG
LAGRKRSAEAEAHRPAAGRFLRRAFRTVKRNFVKDETGAAMVEFAIVSALIFIPLVFGILEFGRLTWAKDMVTTAAREGTRFAIVHGLDYDSAGGVAFDSAAVASYVEAKTQLSPIKVQTAWTNDKSPGDTVVVTVSYVYTPVVKVPGLLTSKTVTGTSTQIIAY